MDCQNISVYKPKRWKSLLYLQQKVSVMNKDLAKLIIAENQKFISSVKFYQRDYQFETKTRRKIISFVPTDSHTLTARA